MTTFDALVNGILRIAFGGLFCWFVLRVIAKEYHERINGLKQLRKYLMGALVSFLAFSEASVVFFYYEAFNVPYDRATLTTIIVYFNTVAFIFGVASWILICHKERDE
jgi:hypothetical protein